MEFNKRQAIGTGCAIFMYSIFVGYDGFTQSEYCDLLKIIGICFAGMIFSAVADFLTNDKS